MMDPDSPTLPELLTRPLADNAELRFFIQADLEQRMATATPGPKDDTAEQALRKMQAARQRNLTRDGKRMIGVYVALLILWLVAVAAEAPGLILEETWRGTFSEFRPSKEYPSELPPRLQEIGERHVAELHRGVPWIAFVWKDLDRRMVDSTAMWSKMPDSPTAYFVYVIDYYFSQKHLPEDFDEVWQRIDSGNAAWLLLKAGLLATGSTGPDAKRQRVIKDPEVFAQAIEVLAEASRQPRFVDLEAAQSDLMKSFMKKPSGQVEATVLYQTLIWSPRRFGAFSVFSPESERLRQAGDLAGLESFSAVFRRIGLLAYQHRDRTGFSEFYVRPLLESVRKAGLKEEMKRWDELNQALGDGQEKEAGSWAARLVGKCMAWSPLDGAEKMRWIRYAVLFVGGIASLGAALLWFSLWPRGDVADGCSACLTTLAYQRGWRRLFLLGGVLPCLVSLSWTGLISDRYTSLETLIRHGGGAALAAVWVSLFHFSEMDLARSLGFLGIRVPRWKANTGRVMVACALTATVIMWFAAGLDRYDGSKLLRKMSSGLCELPLLWMAGCFAAMLIGRDGALRRRLLARRMIPILVTVSAGLLIVSGLLSLTERLLVSGDLIKLRTPLNDTAWDGRVQRLADLKTTWDREEGKKE